MDNNTDVMTVRLPYGAAKKYNVPGELGIWAFICSDLSVFSLYFITYLFQRSEHRADFIAGSNMLHLSLGVFNTLVLVTSSLFLALAVQAIRFGQGRKGQNFMRLAMAGGVCFVLIKGIEWGLNLRLGYGPHANNFFQIYYMMTGLHLLHVLVGLIVLQKLWRLAGQVKTTPTPRQIRFLENGATYWHMVDLIWLVLFALFYMIK